MPNLAQLTDAYEPEIVQDTLPVENPYRRVPVYMSDIEDRRNDATIDTVTWPRPDGILQLPNIIEANDGLLIGFDANKDFAKEEKNNKLGSKLGIDYLDNNKPSKTSVAINDILNKLFRDDDKRYQLWPEKVVREALTGAGDVASGKVPTMAIDPATGYVHTSPQMIEKAQAISALAGSGGLGGVTDATLGATPFLRPALKYKDRLYKGKEGQQHMDVIPENLYPEFQQMAMSGEDISHYNFGFVNDKGHFLDREKALKYAVDTGIVDKHAAQYGALTSTLMADSTKPGMAIEAMGKANPFFSAVEHNVAKIPQSKMTGDQWLGTLSNKPGVKPEELDWTGLKSFLEENKGKSITKDQIQEHLADNKVELKEVNKRNKLTPEEEEWLEIAANRKLDNAELKRFSELEAIKTSGDMNATNTKYHSYQLPGGENYREMLLTLPQTNKSKIIKENGYYKVIKPDGEKFGQYNKEWEAQKVADGFDGNFKTQYKSSHWDEPNILAHVRMNDRTIDGKKSLHLEEIQSDWHQQGRDKGYQGQYDLNAATEKYFNHTKKFDKLHPDDQAFVKEQLVKNDRGVPDAPFKKSWYELALKRMIREVAEKGYDRLSWTPGEAQVARYDLSKQVDSLHYNPETKILTANSSKLGQAPIIKQIVEPDKISDFVGKEPAKKLLAAPLNKGGYHSLENADLKIGGEGMKGFYDQIIPKSVNKIAKDYEAKVETGKTKEGQTIHYIDLPEGLKNTALQKGFPLFSSTHMFIPVEHDPFESKR